jgi:EAL domain-containing protein (putative c-di-GMP-specific phosphodiesterase class I)
MSGQPPERRRCLEDFALALAASDQLSLVYQPQIALATGRCTAVEALLRWHHPTLGNIGPANFIPIIETDPLITRLTDWVLDSAMGFAARLAQDGHAIRVGTNIAPANLSVGYLVGRLVELIRRHELAANMLQLEITEGALIGDDNRTRQQLRQIRRIGIGVAIDDFGAGYSNLGYLAQIPADTLKIDRSLVAAIDEDPASGTIVKWLIGLSHELGLEVVAEGVETTATQALLMEWGCDEIQGYLIARPMPERQLLDWLVDYPVA